MIMAGEYDPGQGREHFERPTTRLNQAIRGWADQRPHAELAQTEIDALKTDSLEVFSTITLDDEAVEAMHDVPWYMADVSCPPEVLGGEVTLGTDGGEPEARFFADAPVLAIKSDKRREAALLGLADHFNGHLYGLFTGSKDYGEEAAIYWQGKAAHSRVSRGNDPRFFGATLLNRFGYRGHKDIHPFTAPFDFFPLNSIARAALGRRNGTVEATVLREPASGWARLISEVKGTKSTHYYRRIPLGVAEDVAGALADQEDMPFGVKEDNLMHNILGGVVASDLARVEYIKPDGPAKTDIEQIKKVEALLEAKDIDPSDPSDMEREVLHLTRLVY